MEELQVFSMGAMVLAKSFIFFSLMKNYSEPVVFSVKK